MNNHQKHRYFAVVPAAGIGSRMGAERPKQYLPLGESTVIEQTLSRLLILDCLESIVVPLSDKDQYWQNLSVANSPRIQSTLGGVERSDSVLAGLKALQGIAENDDWVLVHDVARPCVRLKDIEALMTVLADDEVGGILAVPVSDTIKQVTDKSIDKTVDRSVLWQAQTPQLFRYGMLLKALSEAAEQGVAITDEASAIEWSGAVPKVVEGSRDNIKITCPEDLALAEYYLKMLDVKS